MNGRSIIRDCFWQRRRPFQVPSKSTARNSIINSVRTRRRNNCFTVPTFFFFRFLPPRLSTPNIKDAIFASLQSQEPCVTEGSGESRALRRLAQIQSDRAVSEEAGPDAGCGAPALSLISLMWNRGDDTPSLHRLKMQPF